MYGIEEGTGLGGLAAQAPGGNIYAGRALGIRSVMGGVRGGPIIGGPSVLPQSFGQAGGAGGHGIQVSGSGTAVERPAGQQIGSWREILDFHNSPAPWVLIAILIIYAWTHASYRARGAVELGIARR